MQVAVRREQLVPQRKPHANVAYFVLFDFDPDEPGKAVLSDPAECVEINQRQLTPWRAWPGTAGSRRDSRPGSKSSWRARSASRTSSRSLAGVLGDVLRDRVDLGVGENALERRHDAAAVDHLLLGDRERRFEDVEVRPLRSGRSRGLERVTAAALRDEDLIPVRPANGGGLREALKPRVRGDVGRDVDRALSGDEVGGHVRREVIRIALTNRILPRELDLVVNDVEDRGLLVAVGAGLRERGVKIGTDRSRRAGGRERVAARA